MRGVNLGLSECLGEVVRLHLSSWLCFHSLPVWHSLTTSDESCCHTKEPLRLSCLLRQQCPVCRHTGSEWVCVAVLHSHFSLTDDDLVNSELTLCFGRGHKSSGLAAVICSGILTMITYFFYLYGHLNFSLESHWYRSLFCKGAQQQLDIKGYRHKHFNQGGA